MSRRVVLSVMLILGSATAHAQPEDGPPSETLANALRLYQQERYADAAPFLDQVARGRTGDAPAQRQKAQFFLGKAQYHLQRYNDALHTLSAISAAGSAHLYFSNTLQWLVLLQEEIPEARSEPLYRAIGVYEEHDLAQYDNPESRDLHAAALYCLSRARFQQQRYQEAYDLAQRVPAGTPSYVPTQNFLLARILPTIGPN